MVNTYDDETALAVTEHWDRASATYDALASHGLGSERERRAWCALLDRWLPAPPCRVLDVGTGTGFLAYRVAELGHHVLGVDRSQGMLDVARAGARDGGPGTVEFRTADADLTDLDLGQLDGFDAVVCRHVVWTLPRPEATLRRWRAVLRPGGVVLAIDGTWFPHSFTDRVAVGAANVVRRFGSRAREHGDGVYATSGADVFPLLGARSPRPMHNAFERAGFVAVHSEYLDGIDAVERAGATLADRLAHRWRRFAVDGRAPGGGFAPRPAG